MENKIRAPRNRTINLTQKEIHDFSGRLISLSGKTPLKKILGRTINQDFFEAVDFLPDNFADMIFIDPPYNLHKSFNLVKFREKSVAEYSEWLESIILKLKRLLKPDASVYICGDWLTSVSIQNVIDRHFIVRNRITWERDKGRGSKKNWKNNYEDIWFCTVSKKYTFNPDDVKVVRRVIAPYKDGNGEPKDWKKSGKGSYRMTHASNLWSDISIPFWSMPENTDHPTQKPEKLLAKLILASTNPGDVVLDPFCGSGTTSVVSKKLNRKFIGMELDKFYACLTEKRLRIAEKDNLIQGYEYGVFWERNTNPFPLE